MLTTILILFLAAVAAVFASLSLSDRKDKARYEAKSNELSSEVMRLREELAQSKVSGTRRQLIRKDLILEYLRDEAGLECELMEDRDLIIFKIGDERYHVNTDRLPRQVHLRKGYNVGDADVDWDAMEKAALAVADDLIMVKMNVDRENRTYEYYVVSPDRTIGNFASNFEFYVGLFGDAERCFADRYKEFSKDREEEREKVMSGEMIRKQFEAQKLKS